MFWSSSCKKGNSETACACIKIWNAEVPTCNSICHILTSNENATPKFTSISQGYIEYTFTEDFWGFNEY